MPLRTLANSRFASSFVHDEVRTDRTLKGVVQCRRLGGAERPVPNLRQTGQSPLRGYILVENFHQTSRLL